VLAAVAATNGRRPSACRSGTVRDVAGHLVWARDQLPRLATGIETRRPPARPAPPHPAELAGDNTASHLARRPGRVRADLTGEVLARITSLPGLKRFSVVRRGALLVTDTAVHNLGHRLPTRPAPCELPPVLVTSSFEWSRSHVVRAPGFFGPELTPPDEGDEQTRLLAYLGRAALAISVVAEGCRVRIDGQGPPSSHTLGGLGMSRVRSRPGKEAAVAGLSASSWARRLGGRRPSPVR